MGCGTCVEVVVGGPGLKSEVVEVVVGGPVRGGGRGGLFGE